MKHFNVNTAMLFLIVYMITLFSSLESVLSWFKSYFHLNLNVIETLVLIMSKICWCKSTRFSFISLTLHISCNFYTGATQFLSLKEIHLNVRLVIPTCVLRVSSHINLSVFSSYCALWYPFWTAPIVNPCNSVVVSSSYFCNLLGFSFVICCYYSTFQTISPKVRHLVTPNKFPSITTTTQHINCNTETIKKTILIKSTFVTNSFMNLRLKFFQSLMTSLLRLLLCYCIKS